MKRLMLFIEPTSAQLNIFSQFTLPRLGSFILAGLVNRRDGWNARVFVEGRKRFELQAWITEHDRPDAVGISTITATVQRGCSRMNAARKASRSSSADPMSPSCPTRRWVMETSSCAAKAKGRWMRCWTSGSLAP